jgi:broad specificity phosphatase PhoE
MSKVLPIIYLVRHGETAWTLSGQHTGLTDLPLTKAGEMNARYLAERLHGITFAKVLTSPLQRATRTRELAGFGVAEIDRRKDRTLAGRTMHRGDPTRASSDTTRPGAVRLRDSVPAQRFR